ncbi:nucleotidyltransferase (macronuclear) [Tetrahymena thermophila SB210]|uniref:Nucleotidyltransferase n=1 Tax=Tetrahymena thermophila (strain SB210) TaxID=312017 RepID=I7MCZ3_TETTS|nr:nucleotidyltransferase [Tetrahymena thermophila SB210]EAR85195.2 nucleotidyltransferase [Tetrahymena thermophila SB210]|eukprot:XP_001032858.2 nucleotidyltransferase [Tetrahymena thermophila SB210]
MSQNPKMETLTDQTFVRKCIIKFIQDLENKFSIKVIFACEGGSRGWGTHTDDSDYDVRGIYILSEDQYMSVTKSKGIISGFSQKIPETNVLFDYIFIDFRKFLKRNIINEKNQLNFILQSKTWYINKFPEDILSELKIKLPVPLRGIKGHLNDLTKQVKNAQKISPKQALNCFIYGLQLIHIYVFDSFPFYSSQDQIEFLQNQISQNKDNLNIGQQQNVQLERIFEEFKIDLILEKFKQYLELKKHNQQSIPEQDNLIIQNFSQDVMNYKYDIKMQSITSSQLDQIFRKMVSYNEQYEE